MKHTHMLSAAAALLFVATAAQAQHRQDDHLDRQAQRGQVSLQVQPRPHDGNPRRGRTEVQQRQLDRGRDGWARGEEMKNQQSNARYGEEQHSPQMRHHDVQVRQRERTAEIERERQFKERDRLLQARGARR